MPTDRTFRIYLLAVCFVSVVCIAITAGISLYSLLKIAAPELTLDSYSYNAHQSLDDFKKSHFYARRLQPQGMYFRHDMRAAKRQAEALENTALMDEPESLTREQTEQLRVDSYQTLIKNHKRSAMQELIRTAITLVISCILFFIHWRQIQKYDKAVA